MFRRRAATRVAVSALLFACSPLHATELPDPPSRDDGYIEVGAFHLRPGFTIKDVGYESNVFLSNEDQTSDFTFTLAPSLESVVLFGHRGRLDMKEELGIVRFASTSSQNHVDSDTELDWQVLFSDFLYKGGAGLETAKLRPSDEITERVRFDGLSLYGEIEWSKTERSTFFTRIEAENYDYRDNPEVTVSDLNRDEYTYTIGGSYRLRPKTDVTMEVSREDYRFDDVSLARNTRGWRFMPGLKFDDAAVLQGELRIGYLDFAPHAAGRTDYDGVVADSALSKTFGRRLRLTARYERDVIFSIFENNLYFLARTTGLEATTSLSNRFRIDLGSSLSRNSYPDEVQLPSLSGQRRDEIRAVWLGGSYRVAGAPWVGLKLQYRERTSNYEPAEFDDVRILGNATYTF